MSTDPDLRDEPAAADAATATEDQAEPKRRLELGVDISDAGPCKKHIRVEVPRAEVERQFDETLKELRREAAVPGFRPGRAPRGLVQRRYRKEVAGQVKSTLLMACMEQLDEDHKLNPISQPKLDLDAIELPDDGPMRFEMDVEVRPEFTLPDYKGLILKRPVKEVGEADVDAQVRSFLERYAQLVPKFEGGAELGDLLTADLVFHKDGVRFNEVKELQLRLQPELRFQDGKVPDAAGALVGARPGDVREAEAQIGTSSPDPALRGQTIHVTFHVHDLKRLRLPEMNAEFLETVGFESEAELRAALRGVLERRLKFLQRQALRRQVVDRLLAEAPFDLPADLVTRQERLTLRRQVEEMRQAGLSEGEIRAREAEVRADAHEQTLRSLKEFFLLAKVAEAEDIKVEDDDLEAEIEAIAERAGESARRVRARVEKEGLADSLAEQILERKALDRILDQVTVEDVPMVEEQAVETLDQVASPPAAEEAPETSAPPPAEPAG
jgi:trigger factor